MQKGDIFQIINKKNLEIVKTVKILKLKEVRFKDLTKEDWEGHEKFLSDKEMYKAYNKYYSQKIDENTLLKIVKFEILE